MNGYTRGQITLLFGFSSIPPIVFGLLLDSVTLGVGITISIILTFILWVMTMSSGLVKGYWDFVFEVNNDDDPTYSKVENKYTKQNKYSSVNKYKYK